MTGTVCAVSVSASNNITRAVRLCCFDNARGTRNASLSHRAASCQRCCLPAPIASWSAILQATADSSLPRAALCWRSSLCSAAPLVNSPATDRCSTDASTDAARTPGTSENARSSVAYSFSSETPTEAIFDANS